MEGRRYDGVIVPYRDPPPPPRQAPSAALGSALAGLAGAAVVLVGVLATGACTDGSLVGLAAVVGVAVGLLGAERDLRRR